MTSNFFHGSRVTTDPSSYTAPIRRTNRSHVGMVGTAAPAQGVTQDQLDEAFPLNEPVAVTPENAHTLLPLMNPDPESGTIRYNLQRQWNVIASPTAVVRVAPAGFDPNELPKTLANAAGNNNDKTGIWALLKARSIGINPRTLVAPGLSHQTLVGQVTGVTVDTEGEGYGAGTTVTFSAPTGGGGVTAEGEPIFGGGLDADHVVGVRITNPGAGYTNPPMVTIADADTPVETPAAAATATISMAQQNAVVAAGAVVCNRLRAMMPYDIAPDVDPVKEVIRNNYGSRRLYGGWPRALVSGDIAPERSWWSPIVAGMMVDLLQNPIEWYQSVSNKVMPGVVGVTETIDQEEANRLNEANIATILSLPGGGIVNWGNYTQAGSTEQGYRLYHAVRIADAIEEAIERSNRQFVDRCYSTAQFINEVTENVNTFLRSLTGTAIVGGNCWAVPEDQDSENIRFIYDFTTAYIAQGISGTARIVNTYTLNFPAR